MLFLMVFAASEWLGVSRDSWQSKKAMFAVWRYVANRKSACSCNQL